MERIKFGLLGAGGFAREVMPFVKKSISNSLKVSENQIDTFFIETWQPERKEVNGYPLISLEEFSALDGEKYFNVAVGNGIDREKMAVAAAKHAITLSLFSSQTIIFDNNSIADGALFCPNSMVTSNVNIGKYFQCNLYSYVAHDCVIGDFVTFAPGVRCNGRVHIGDYAYIGTNAIIREGTPDKPLRIGKGAVVGMGAVVTKDVPDGAIVIGNPARRMIKN
jgi:sugar O-acyltransferase (sialic acid O-acetyltransferase NeuD family)